ncbi:L-fucose:H+ symporter permease [Pedobacter sp. MC2016-24]|uniref:L-fucose:H+ symporter permease n=1 Tax=Pedobacter sp. MC2016-24 TaxID=2780090 RepID=UPI00187E3BDF|nr:L-fucose:H+ symporter permease [Pedobacter sp. MC2016-24]MBE9600351.1 L-fucose:H+ symporter permease [Pedobacter sp. MC2016-24]
MAKNKYLFPLIMITSLFFMWGFAYGLLDVLNKHFQEALNITKSRSTLLQAAYFGAYFLVALPAGIFMNKYGYKKGIIMGLILYAVGAFLFYPAAEQSSFNAFLLALFILASGLACLETAANPYVTVLGTPETSATRLNLSQCFNGVGSFLGPIIASYLFFGEKSSTDNGNLDSVKMIYVVIGILVLIVAAIFVRTKLPEIKDNETVSSEVFNQKPLFSHSNFSLGVVTQFFYVAAQVGVATLFINYCTESHIGIDNAMAAKLLSIGLILFTAGRFIGTALMRVIKPNQLLATYSVVNVLLCAVVMWNNAWLSVYSLMALFFFMSIMFPTIFALSIKDLGQHTKKASSFVIMSIVGGALVPYVMGTIADHYSTPISYVVPMICFIVVFLYGIRGYKIIKN